MHIIRCNNKKISSRSEMRLQRLMHSMSLAAGNSPPRFTGALQAPKVAPSRSASVCFFR